MIVSKQFNFCSKNSFRFSTTIDSPPSIIVAKGNKVPKVVKMKRKVNDSTETTSASSPPVSPSTKGKKTKSAKTSAKTIVPTVPCVENAPDDNGKMIHDVIIPRSLSKELTTCKVISWNVAGLRAIIKKSPLIIDNLIKTHDPDIICLQETKIQVDHVSEFEELFSKFPSCGHSYTSFWSCSTTKLGYSGTMVLVKNSGLQNNTTATACASSSTSSETSAKTASKPKQATLAGLWGKKAPAATDTDTDTASAAVNTNVDSAGTGHNKLDVVSVAYDCQLPSTMGESGSNSKLCPGEGRTITVEFPGFYLINCYVPNSGQDLVRLDYRTKTWDTGLQRYLDTLQQQKPVIFTGDLNCGHLDLDIHNCHAKHIVKQSGLTPEERTGFSTMLTGGTQPSPPAASVPGASTGFIDALRFCYPYARGQFSYWSQRSFARPVNKGIRLDYFICSKSFVAWYEEKAAAAGVTMSELVQEEEARALVDIDAAPTAPRTIQSNVDRLLQRIGAETGTGAGAGTETVALPAKVEAPLLLDSYTLPNDTVGISDHGPVILVLQL